MPIEIYPTKIEAHNTEYNYPVFEIELLDECSAKVVVKCCTNATEWDDISKAIKEALIMMKFTGDKVEQ